MKIGSRLDAKSGKNAEVEGPVSDLEEQDLKLRKQILREKEE